jgi:hypothetical protein
MPSWLDGLHGKSSAAHTTKLLLGEISVEITALLHPGFGKEIGPHQIMAKRTASKMVPISV